MSDAEEQEEEKKRRNESGGEDKRTFPATELFFRVWPPDHGIPFSLSVASFLVSISLRVFYFVGTIFIRCSLTRVQLFSSIHDFCETTRV